MKQQLCAAPGQLASEPPCRPLAQQRCNGASTPGQDGLPQRLHSAPGHGARGARRGARLAQLVLLLRLPGGQLPPVGLLLLQQALQYRLAAVQVAVGRAHGVLPRAPT